MFGLTLKRNEPELITNPEFTTKNSGRFVILRKSSVWGWETISETQKGVPFKDVQSIYEYHVKFKKIHPSDLLIVKVEED